MAGSLIRTPLTPCSGAAGGLGLRPSQRHHSGGFVVSCGGGFEDGLEHRRRNHGCSGYSCTNGGGLYFEVGGNFFFVKTMVSEPFWAV